MLNLFHSLLFSLFQDCLCWARWILLSIRNAQKDFTTRQNILPSQGCRCYLSNRPAILLAHAFVGGWGEEKVRGGRWERTPSAYRFLIVLFLLEYSAGGSVEDSEV